MPAAVILNLIASKPLSVELFFPIVYGAIAYHVCNPYSVQKWPRITRGSIRDDVIPTQVLTGSTVSPNQKGANDWEV